MGTYQRVVGPNKDLSVEVEYQDILLRCRLNMTISGIHDPEMIRREFEKKMTDRSKVITRRVNDYCVPALNEIATNYSDKGVERPWASAANHCSEILFKAKDRVLEDFRGTLDSGLTEEQKLQKEMQSLKSSAGKIFERFTAYAISRMLSGTKFAVWKDTDDIKQYIGSDISGILGLTRLDFGREIKISLEADYIVFCPSSFPKKTILVSSKSSMKDRLHNVTMWAILKKIAEDEDLSETYAISPNNRSLLQESRYVLVTGDLARQQPDLRAEPRKLILFDLSFYDFSFAAVTHDWNNDIPDSIDIESRKPIYRLSAFRDIIS